MIAAGLQTLSFELPQPHVAMLTLNRPEVANAIDTRMAEELLQVFTGLLHDSADLRCLIVTGRGARAFCAGGDLKQRNTMTDAQWAAQHAVMERAVVAMLDCPIPIIAAVNGAAVGGGCEIALLADFIYAAQHASFALTETRLGIFPGAGGTQTLPRAIGSRRAIELICSARPFTADEAFQWGLVNQLLPPDELMPAALATAQRIASNAPLAVMQAKKSIRVGTQMDLQQGLKFSIEAYHRLIGTRDRIEGVRAFVEKRAPSFTGS